MVKAYQARINLNLNQGRVNTLVVPVDNARLELQISGNDVTSLSNYSSVEFKMKKSNGSIETVTGTIETNATGIKVAVYDYSIASKSLDDVIEIALSLVDAAGNKTPTPPLRIQAATRTSVATRQREEFVATEGQTVFTLSNNYDQFLNRLDVIVGQVAQFSPSNYTETSRNSFTLSEGIPAGTRVIVTYYT